MAGRAPIVLTYKLRLSDLAWMWETSPIALPIMAGMTAVGLVLLSAILDPAGKPIEQDIFFGFLLIALGPIMPLWGIWATGGLWMRGRTIRLKFDGEGLQGWPVPVFRETTWAKLKSPRLESRVLVLPFSSWGDAVAVVPARALTPGQLAKIVALLNDQGHLLHGDNRGPVGIALGPIMDRGPLVASVEGHRRLRRLPRFSERSGTGLA